MNKNQIFEPMKYRLIYFAISLIVLIPGVYSLTRFGLKPSIDFTGGSTITLKSKQLTSKTLKNRLAQDNIEIKSLKQDNSNWEIKTSPIPRETYEEILQDLKNQDPNITEKEYFTVGPSLGRELIRKTIYGIILAAGLIMLYVTYRFKSLKYGATAILAMFHDTFILLGTFSILGHFYGVEIDTFFVTAVLTTLSFSVHDTIVVYDRIRELKKQHSYLGFKKIVNRAVVETLGRSINNSMTIIFMLLAMYLLGGDTIKWFILALLVGAISGTYSSTFTAAPLLLTWNNLITQKSKNN